MYRYFTILILFIFVKFNAISQNQNYLFLPEGETKTTIKFKLVSNLIVIPLMINNTDSLNFILDTGLKVSLITKIPNKESLALNNTKKLNIKGLGSDKDLEVYHSYGNNIKLSNIVGNNCSFYIILNEDFNLSEELGMEINGLIGADVFTNFIVHIDYFSMKITLHNPKTFKYTRKYKRYETLPLELINSKPYIKLPITMHNNVTVISKLLIDTGSSDAIWLFPTTNKNIEISERRKYTFLGTGLNGKIYGYQGRVKAVNIGKYSFKKVNTSFPDSVSIINLMNKTKIGRNGSVGAEVMRRFNILFDYPNNKISFKKNYNFRDKFNFNMAGMEVIAPLIGLPYYTISYIEGKSPAQKAGLQVGDQILSINHTNVASYNVLEINSLMRSKAGKTIRLKYKRKNKVFKTKFKLIDKI